MRKERNFTKTNTSPKYNRGMQNYLFRVVFHKCFSADQFQHHSASFVYKMVIFFLCEIISILLLTVCAKRSRISWNTIQKYYQEWRVERGWIYFIFFCQVSNNDKYYLSGIYVTTSKTSRCIYGATIWSFKNEQRCFCELEYFISSDP